MADDGHLLTQQGLAAEAVRHLDEALRIDPRHGAASANRQAVLAQMQERR